MTKHHQEREGEEPTLWIDLDRDAMGGSCKAKDTKAHLDELEAALRDRG